MSAEPLRACPVSQALVEADAAFEAADWEVAARAYERALEEGADPAALDRLGQVRWFQGRIDEGLVLRERAYAGFCRRGDHAAAAQAALWLMVEYASSRGPTPSPTGWFLRAERPLEDAAVCPAHVELEVARARRAAGEGEGDEAAERHFACALELARTLGSASAEVRVLTVLGVHRVAQGQVADGMALLDEVMAAVLGGGLDDPWSVGSACCQMLVACDATRRIGERKLALA